jgi:hypothetical protein
MASVATNIQVSSADGLRPHDQGAGQNEQQQQSSHGGCIAPLLLFSLEIVYGTRITGKP